MGVDPGRDRTGSPKISRGGDINIDISTPTVSVCYLHLYLGFFTFSPKSEAYAIKRGRRQVLDVLVHLGSDLQTLRWIDATH